MQKSHCLYRKRLVYALIFFEDLYSLFFSHKHKHIQIKRKSITFLIATLPYFIRRFKVYINRINILNSLKIKKHEKNNFYSNFNCNPY